MRVRTVVSAVAALATASAFGQGVLLIPNSGTGFKSVMAFNPQDGTPINTSFIVDPTHLQTPKDATDSGRGSILVSDQVSDAVFEYSYSGAYMGVVAGTGSSIPLDNIRGIEVKNGYLYISNSGSTAGAPGQAIVRVDLTLGTSVVWPLGAVDPFDVLCRENDILVTDINGDDIVHYDYNGNYLGILHNSDGISGVDFPQQLAEDANGDILLAGFTAPIGVFRYDSAGVQQNFYSIGTGDRGVRRLGNGQILYTYSTRVDRFDPSTTTNTQMYSGGAIQYIGYANGYDCPVTGFQVIEGTEFSGDPDAQILQRLRSSDDQYLSAFNDDATLGCAIEFYGHTYAANPTSYEIKVETNAARLGLAERLAVFNYSTNQYNTVNGRTATSTDAPYTVTLTSNVGNYIDNGAVKAKLSWSPINDEAPAFDGWLHSVDQFYWTIRP